MSDPKKQIRGGLSVRGNLDAVVKRRPVTRRRLFGYVVALVLAVVGFVGGNVVSGSVVGGITAAVVLFLVGILASEFWPTTVVHEKEEHHRNL
jgi:hypothetical protein